MRAAVFSIGLRGVSLGSKFVLMLVMARFLSPGEMGAYGLITGTVGIAIYVLGLDFYVFSTRELLAREAGERGSLLRDQAVFHLVSYVVVLPALLVVFAAGFVPWRYLGWLYLVLVAEHVAQESYRLLIVVGKPVLANLAFFLRAGAWAYPVLALFVLAVGARHVETVLAAWTLGAGSSAVLGVVALMRAFGDGAGRAAVDWRWIRRTAVGSLPFFLSTLALRGVEYSDRFFLQRSAGEQAVGVYTFFFSLAYTVSTLVQAGVVQVLYPRVVASFQRGQVAEYRALLKRMAVGSIAVAVGGALAIALVVRLILLLVNRPIYAEHLATLWLLLGGVLVNSMATLPSWALYVRHRDRQILGANLCGLLVSICSNAILVPRYGVYGAAFTTIIANVAIGAATMLFLLNGTADVRSAA
jgi:O-antigen/teichoic acid export membrane protein